MPTYVNGQKTEPTVGAWFTVHDVEGRFLPEDTVGFTDVEGLVRETDAIVYKEGNELYERHVAGRTKAGQITLRRSTDGANYLSRWKAAIEEASARSPSEYKVTLIVSMYDRRGTPGSGGSDTKVLLRRWKLEGAMCIKLDEGNLSGQAGEVHMETATIAHDGPILQLYPILDTQLNVT